MQSAPATFSGYPAPTSSTTYTPNQFFDVVLPHSSRGVVRIVGYMLRRILGWSDPDGNPREPQVSFSYAELIAQANVSRSMIKDALDEAIASNFIRCVREPRQKLPGQNAVSGMYELAWDDSGEYVRNIENFRGFYSENGNLTYIPNKFFDHTVREESLSVAKVVGAILRHTIGFRAQHGTRRQQVQMSFTTLQRVTAINSRPILSQALQEALEKGHIVKVREGHFSPGGADENSISVYAVRWEDGAIGRGGPVRKIDKGEAENFFTPSKSDREQNQIGPSDRKEHLLSHAFVSTPNQTIGPKTEPGEHFLSVRKQNQGNAKHRYEKRTRNGSKREPASVREAHRDRFEKSTCIEITDEITLLNNSKQKPAAVLELIERLEREGFDSPTASALVERFPSDRIERQLQYLPGRKPSKNALGFLRRAIEEDWPPTLTVVPGSQTRPASAGKPIDSGKSEKDYKDFCITKARNIRLASPEIYEAFQLEDAQYRERLFASPLVTGAVRETLLRSIDSDSAVESRFAEHLVKLGRIITSSQFEALRAKRING